MSTKQKRARQRIVMSVYQGRRPPARSLLCVDCGGPAAEYDHFKGYDTNDVEPVCAPCHEDREKKRRRAAHPHPWIEMPGMGNRCRTCWNTYRRERKARLRALKPN